VCVLRMRAWRSEPASQPLNHHKLSHHCASKQPLPCVLGRMDVCAWPWVHQDAQQVHAAARALRQAVSLCSALEAEQWWPDSCATHRMPLTAKWGVHAAGAGLAREIHCRMWSFVAKYMRASNGDKLVEHSALHYIVQSLCQEGRCNSLGSSHARSSSTICARP
jgi:hypothetical protein